MLRIDVIAWLLVGTALTLWRLLDDRPLLIRLALWLLAGARAAGWAQSRLRHLAMGLEYAEALNRHPHCRACAKTEAEQG
jgi:hypothetical protein